MEQQFVGRGFGRFYFVGLPFRWENKRAPKNNKRAEFKIAAKQPDSGKYTAQVTIRYLEYRKTDVQQARGWLQRPLSSSASMFCVLRPVLSSPAHGSMTPAMAQIEIGVVRFL
jgi:hypothetical protein